MPKYRNKPLPPIVLEAWQYQKDAPIPVWVARKCHNLGDGAWTCNTIWGLVYANPGDWIVATADMSGVQVMTNEEFEAAFESVEAPPTILPPFQPTHRHKKRGSFYQRLGAGQLQAARPVGDLAVVTIYQAEDGTLWVRPTAEFEDGRFEKLKAPPIPDAV